MPIPLDHLTFYAALQRLVRSGQYPDAVVAAVTQAAEEARGAVSEAALISALKAGDADAVVRAMEQDRYAAVLSRVADPLRSVGARAAAIALEELPKVTGYMPRVAVEIRATAAASRRAGDLVTNATRETQLAVRELAEQALLEGRDVHQAARSIKRIIGLNRQQAGALEQFAAEAVDSPAYRSPAGVAQAIERERNRLLNKRADTIARTELWQAGQDGQREVWREAAESGVLDIVGIDAVFVSRYGEESDGPLLHVRCDCSQRLRAIDIEGRRVYVREWVVSVRNPCERCLSFKGSMALP